MSKEKFDPFSSRLARDIRNTLSRSFLQSLVERDVSLFRETAAEFMGRDLGQVYCNYINNRVSRYAEVLTYVKQKQVHDELQQAEILWNHKLYFEMHELLETLWKKSAGEERRALQGLIQAAGMMLHAENNNTAAAIKMGRKALANLQISSGALPVSAGLELILAEIKQVLATLEYSSRAH